MRYLKFTFIFSAYFLCSCGNSDKPVTADGDKAPENKETVLPSNNTPSNSQSNDTKNSESKDSKPVQKVLTFAGLYFLASTGEENYSSDKIAVQNLQKTRADMLCKLLGYSNGSGTFELGILRRKVDYFYRPLQALLADESLSILKTDYSDKETYGAPVPTNVFTKLFCLHEDLQSNQSKLINDLEQEVAKAQPYQVFTGDQLIENGLRYLASTGEENWKPTLEKEKFRKPRADLICRKQGFAKGSLYFNVLDFDNSDVDLDRNGHPDAPAGHALIVDSQFKSSIQEVRSHTIVTHTMPWSAFGDILCKKN